MKRTLLFSKSALCQAIVGLGLLLCTEGLAQTELKRRVELEWEQIPGASSYEIEIGKVGGSNKPLYFKTQKTVFNGKLRPGHYQMRIRSYDRRSVPGEWSEPAEFWANLEAPQIKSPTGEISVGTAKTPVHFEWAPVASARGYLIKIRSKDGRFKKEMSVTSPSLKLQLPVPGPYAWDVQAISSEKHPGDEAKAEFSLNRTVAQPMLSPDPEASTLKWKKAPEVESYSVRLLQKTESGFKQIEAQERWTANEFYLKEDLPAGEYQLEVQARSQNTLSKAAKFEFKRTEQERQKRIARKALRDEPRYYAWARYDLTSLQYKGYFAETDQSIRYDALGGDGELGLGFKPLGSRFGYQASLGANGYVIGDDTLTHLHGSASILYTHFVRLLEVRWNAGLQFRQYTITSSTLESEYDHQKSSTVNPEIGVRLWHPLWGPFGVAGDLQVQSSVLSSEGPNGNKITPSPSYQIGVLGSYKLSSRWTGFMGYTYRVDALRYQAQTGSAMDASSGLAQEGDQNAVETSSHNLTLKLELRF